MRVGRWRVTFTFLRVSPLLWWHAEHKEYESAKLKLIYRRLQIGPLMFEAKRPKEAP